MAQLIDNFYFDVLPLLQQKLWPFLKGLADLGYILNGGTAISLLYGHRVSKDFDFFLLNHKIF
jgi:hypothetical protein